MCLTPLKIKNPNYGHGHDSKYMAAYDCTSQYIYVPCGHCYECRTRRQSDLVQRMKFEAQSHYVYFFTLTYDNDHLPKVIVEDANGNPVEFCYCDFHHIQNFLKLLRKRNIIDRPVRYMCVSEYGKRFARPHYHGNLLVPKMPGDNEWTPYLFEKVLFDYFKNNWAVNVGTRKNPVYEPLYTYHEAYRHGVYNSNFDLHYVSPGPNGEADVAFYVTKYIMKDSDQVSRIKALLHSCFPDDDDPVQRAQFRDYWRLIGPKCVKSIYFGLNPVMSPFGYMFDESITNLIRKGLEDSVKFDAKGPSIYDPVNGKFVPCARYYSKRFMLFEEQLYFSSKRIDPFTSALYVGDDTAVSDYSMKNLAVRFSRAQKIERQISSKYNDSMSIVESFDEMPEIYYSPDD